MKIETSKGKNFNIEFICSPLRDGSKAIIEMEDARPLAEIAADFDGLESIKKKTRDAVRAFMKCMKAFLGSSRYSAILLPGAFV